MVLRLVIDGGVSFLSSASIELHVGGFWARIEHFHWLFSEHLGVNALFLVRGDISHYIRSTHRLRLFSYTFLFLACFTDPIRHRHCILPL